MYEILSAYLENGLQVILHKIPHARTVSCGLWIKQGSSYENDQTSGFSHLIEHLIINNEMVGSTDIKGLFDEVSNNGVIYNAGTTKEATSYYFSGMKNQLPKCVEILSKMVKEDRTISNEGFELEKSVVRQEAVSFYSSFNQIRERSSQALWGNTSIGRPILGKVENLDTVKLKDLKEIIHDTYVPSNSILVVVGGIDYENTLSLVDQNFNDWHDKDLTRVFENVDHDAGIFFNNNKKTQSSVFSICFRTPSFNDINRVNMSIISKMIGDSGLTSRMMQKIRSENGLAYQTGSFVNFYNECGTFGLTSLCKHKNVEKIIQIINEEMMGIIDDGFTEQELHRSKNILETQTLLNLNDVEAQMKFIAKNALYGHMFSLENELRMIQKTSLNSINLAAVNVFDDKNVGFAGIGDFDLDQVVSSICFERR